MACASRLGSSPSGRLCAVKAPKAMAAMWMLADGVPRTETVLAAERAGGEVEILLGGLELVGCDGACLGDDLVGRPWRRRFLQPPANATRPAPTA